MTANIKLSQDKSQPVRTTKMAYVDSIVKPPRNIARKQVRTNLLQIYSCISTYIVTSMSVQSVELFVCFNHVQKKKGRRCGSRIVGQNFRYD